MNSDQRATLRVETAAMLKTAVAAAGGDISDVCSILMCALLIEHAGVFINSGQTEHAGFIDLRRQLADNYPTAYRSAAAILCEATGRN